MVWKASEPCHSELRGLCGVFGQLDTASLGECQWGTEYLRKGNEFKSQLQKRQLCSLRRFLGVKSTGHETLREVLKANLHLADRGWSAHVSKSFNGMRNEEVFKQKMPIASKIPMQDCYRGYEVHTAEGLEGSGCPQYPRGEQESNDLTSLLSCPNRQVPQCSPFPALQPYKTWTASVY
eukprot:1155471-Pelagomonas_calceolata.AAC.1